MGIDTMGSYAMKSARRYTTTRHTRRRHTGGFTLIASLLMLLLLSGIAIGLMMMVNTEGKVGGTDLQNNVAYHAAEGGIEKMYSDLAQVFQNSMAPKASAICAVSGTSYQPVMTGVTWQTYSVAPGSGCSGTPQATWKPISAGEDQGLYAQVIPVDMMATAQMLGGQEVTMTRSAQVALIPVFQFGVFSESDLSFFSGPNFDMVGPVHTNGDLYPFVGPGSTLTFHNKLSAYGNVVRTQLANGWGAATNYNGTVYIPTTNNGCTAPVAPATTPGACQAMDGPTAASDGDGSVTGAGSAVPQTGATYIPTLTPNTWGTFVGSTNSEIVNGNFGSTTPANTAGVGAKDLKLPFVNGTTLPYQIVRRPPTGEDPASSLAQSREYNLAQIHVLLSDDPADLPGGASDANNVRLVNLTQAQLTAQGMASAPAAGFNPYGIKMTAGNYGAAFGTAPGGDYYSLYFAAASNAVPMAGTVTASSTANGVGSADWPVAPAAWFGNPYNLHPTLQGLQPTGTATTENAPVITGNSASAAPTITLCPPKSSPSPTYYPPQYGYPVGCPSTPAPPYYVASGPATATWNLIDGYLRVEYKDASGNWNPVTNEWLQLGFARSQTPPTLPGTSAPAAGTNPITPNAILLLQEPADRGSGSPSSLPAYAPISTGTAPSCTGTTGSGPIYCKSWTVAPPLLLDAGATYWPFGVTPSSPTTQSVTQFNWYPINFYDAREGEVRDNTVSDNSCSTNGVMNAVEIDVGNLKQWLLGNIGTSGKKVDYLAQNGYVLYFSDRRGMLVNLNAPLPNAPNTKSGDSGLEDVINSEKQLGTPDGALDTVPAGRTASPEDVNGNGQLDSFGAANLGLGFWGTVANLNKNLNTQINGTANPDPFGTGASTTDTSNRIASCSTTARKNWVSGARHVLRLVDGSLGNVPLSPTGTITDPGGFTVASENPVYIWGDYNSAPPPPAPGTDTTWTTGADVLGHSSAAVIADAVTFLSSNWSDLYSTMGNPGGGAGTDNTVTNTNNRNANTDYYRVAVAGGKNINFPQPTWGGVAQDFGTDGGVHNFLRYLENWNGSLNYKGSIVSLYYATYATGVYKCCTTVYQPPTRNYSFDLDFSSPSGLPPGTPMFRDVNSLGYRQLLTIR